MTELRAYVEKNCANIAQIAAIKDGRTVVSECFNGFSPDDALHVMSVTKSVVSLLVGVALDRGLIRGVEQPVLDFFPEYHIKRGERTIQSVTVRHLLTMTAPYKYRSEPWSRVCTSDDWTIAALDLLGGRGGVTDEFRYSTLGIHILTGIIARQSGMRTVDFADKYLLSPLGIGATREFFAETAEEHKAFMLSKEPKRRMWFVDPQGVGAAGYGFCCSALELAEIGRLCLDRGMCGGARVVSREWIDESTAPRLRCGESFGGMRYGYLWWIPDDDSRAYAALGNSGNAIYVDPDKNAVVAVTGTFKPNILDRVRFIREHVEPLL